MDARADFGTHNTDEKRGRIPDTVSIRVLSFADITDEMLAEVPDNFFADFVALSLTVYPLLL